MLDDPTTLKTGDILTANLTIAACAADSDFNLDAAGTDCLETVTKFFLKRYMNDAGDSENFGIFETIADEDEEPFIMDLDKCEVLVNSNEEQRTLMRNIENDEEFWMWHQDVIALFEK